MSNRISATEEVTFELPENSIVSYLYKPHVTIRNIEYDEYGKVKKIIPNKQEKCGILVAVVNEEYKTIIIGMSRTHPNDIYSEMKALSIAIDGRHGIDNLSHTDFKHYKTAIKRFIKRVIRYYPQLQTPGWNVNISRERYMELFKEDINKLK